MSKIGLSLVVAVVLLSHFAIGETNDVTTLTTLATQEVFETTENNLSTPKDNVTAKCECKNGECRKDALGKESCNCFPEYGKKSESVCEACDCGKKANCTFNKGILWWVKYCLCPDGSRVRNGPCKECECKNGKCIKDAQGKESCNCFPEYGKISENVCKACECGKGANCTFDVGFFSTTKYCFCPDGSKVKNGHCKDPCLEHPCLNGGNCSTVGPNFTCACVAPYSGTKCEKSPCSTNPCLNGGKCTVVGNSYNCTCAAPYNGTTCEIDPCTVNPCLNGGKCSVSGKSYKCTCDPPYNGVRCEKDCKCENGECRKDVPKNESCNCLPGYGKMSDTVCKECNCGKGANCTFESGIFLPTKHCLCADGSKTTDEPCKDPCTPNPCKNDGKCRVIKNPLKGNFTCDCTSPYFGEKCDKKCECKNGHCQKDALGNILCNCFPEYGKKSDSVCEECNCGEGANCTFYKEFIWFKKYCLCPDGSKLKNEPCKGTQLCEINECKNGGTCLVSKGGPKCVCAYPYAGNFCTESYWCTEGKGKMCQKGSCRFDFTTQVGRCECAEDQVYSYEKNTCEKKTGQSSPNTGYKGMRAGVIVLSVLLAFVVMVSFYLAYRSGIFRKREDEDKSNLLDLPTTQINN